MKIGEEIEDSVQVPLDKSKGPSRSIKGSSKLHLSFVKVEILNEYNLVYEVWIFTLFLPLVSKFKILYFDQGTKFHFVSGKTTKTFWFRW